MGVRFALQRPGLVCCHVPEPKRLVLTASEPRRPVSAAAVLKEQVASPPAAAVVVAQQALDRAQWLAPVSPSLPRQSRRRARPGSTRGPQALEHRRSTRHPCRATTPFRIRNGT
jgi:hypothetical protein